MREEEQEAYEKAMREIELGAQSDRLSRMQTEQFAGLEKQEQSLATEQLDLSNELLNFYYQLHGYTLAPNEKGILDWQKTKDSELSFLTEEGINFCYWFVQGYLTKNLLLSNYDESTILTKMEDLSEDLNDTLFMKYDTYFRRPTIEECKAELARRIKEKMDLKKVVNEILELNRTENEIKQEVIKEFESRIYVEIEHIRSKLISDKRKMFLSLVRLIQDTIHSAYLRAFKGEERRTLRQHIHISENKGSYPVVQQQKGLSMNPFNLMRGKDR